LPKVKFRREINDIDGFDSEDIVVEGYDPHPTIAMKMSV
jgi:thymidylate synthase